MNTLQTIWSALTVENEMLVKFLAIPLTYLDVLVCMLFFTSILSIETTKKRKLIYVISYGTIASLITFIVPTSYSVFVNIFVWPLMVYFILKASLLKSILSEVITLVITSILEFIFANIFLNFFNITSAMIMVVPAYRLIIVLSIYLILFIITKLINLLKVNVQIFDNMRLKTKILLVVNALLIVLVLAMQFYLLRFYSASMPTYITLISIIGLIAYFVVSLYSIINVSKLESTKIDLENANTTIHSLKILHDQVRSFKHDFDNMVNSIGGYVVNEDIEGLKKYYNQLLEECHKTNNLYALSPTVINHPAIYHLLATKYYEADQKNIQINLDVFLDLNEIEARMRIYDFTRILGILLDNAIDAATECEKKTINVTFRKDLGKNMIVVIIQNTYNNKDVNTETIYQKGVSSKENHSGLGLWKVRQILMHNNNLNLFTTKNDEFFTQQFEIFK